VDDVDAERARARIAHEHEETTRLVGALTIELNAIIDSVALSNNDDEHDPDGATSGYERAKATAMLQHAEARLVEGSYGFCERCGGEIGRDRLDALIATTRCRPCAAESRPRSG
jgi:DnaK suppressor protein